MQGADPAGSKKYPASAGRERMKPLRNVLNLRWQLQYNSPVILTFFLPLAGGTLSGPVDRTAGRPRTCSASTAPRSKTRCSISGSSAMCWGMAAGTTFINNMLLLLVVGPPMEEKYGSHAAAGGHRASRRWCLGRIAMRALFPRTALLGASGIVFMLIMLASLSGFSGGIPVTMLLVAALYLGQQVYDIIFVRDNVANFMHIVGGVCGTVFGYFYALRPQKRRKASGAKPGLKFEKTSRHRSR